MVVQMEMAVVGKGCWLVQQQLVLHPPRPAETEKKVRSGKKKRLLQERGLSQLLQQLQGRPGQGHGVLQQQQQQLQQAHPALQLHQPPYLVQQRL
jgi:hypothetical protein